MISNPTHAVCAVTLTRAEFIGPAPSDIRIVGGLSYGKVVYELSTPLEVEHTYSYSQPISDLNFGTIQIYGFGNTVNLDENGTATFTVESDYTSLTTISVRGSSASTSAVLGSPTLEEVV